jgi:ParB family transcriptional regulator, chromosome partitioning protein
MTARGERKTGLGRGLGALLPTSGESIQQLDVDLIAPNPDQPRKHFAADALEELAESIAQHGVLQPLIVTRDVSASGAVSYRLIAGERRLQAARRAGLARVPAVVREAQANQRLELALVENLQRADLAPLEEAEAFRRLTDEFGLTQEEVGRRVGRGRVAVANALRLMGLPAEIKASLSAGEISAGHARALLGAEDQSEQLRLLQTIRARSLSVRQTEELVRSLRSEAVAKTRQPGRSESAELEALQERLRQALATQVEVQPSRRGGRIVIRYYDDEDLNELLDVLLRGRG